MGKYLSVNNVYFEDDKLIMCDIDTWILAEWNIDSGAHCVISRLMPIGRYGDPKRMGFFVGYFRVRDSIYCMLRNTAQIIEIDVHTGRFIRHGLQYKVNEASCLLYADTRMIDNKIYFLPYELTENILVFDVDTKRYMKEKTLEQILNLSINCTSENKIYKYIYRDEVAWFAISGTDIIAEVNYVKGKTYRIIHSDNNKLKSISGDEEDIFAIGHEGKGVFSVEESGSVKLIVSCDDKYINNCAFVKKVNDKLFLTNSDGSTYVYFPTKEKDRMRVEFPDTFMSIDAVRRVYNRPFSNCLYRNGKLYLIPFSSNGMIVIDADTLEVMHYKLEISEEEVLMEKSKRNDVFNENKAFSLDEYIRYVLTSK